MTVAEAVTAVRSGTAHDNDQQVTDAQLTAELDREYRRVRRWVSQICPSLYQAVAPLATLDSSQNTITKPTDFDRVVRLEQQFGQGYWQPLCVRAHLHMSEGIPRDCSGTYRLTYVQKPVAGYTSYDVPDGVEDLILQPVMAWLRVRHEEDPTPHERRAEKLQRELRPQLSMRYGAHPVSLMTAQFGMGWIGSFYEQGNLLVLV